MDRYQRVERPRNESTIEENEIRITAQGLIRNYVSYATSLLQERRVKEIVLKAMGQAISKSVAVAEIIKKRIPGLHQDSKISSVSITDVWEPIEEGLVPLEMTRHVSMISITLSPGELDKNTPGIGILIHSYTGTKLQPMLNSPDNSSANLADRKANSSSLSMKTPMHEVEAEEGAVDVEGVGVEEAMAVMVDTTKVVTIRVVGIMIIKVGMAAMTIKVGMVVDMATTKADMETTKKMVGIVEDEVVVCVEEATGVTVEAMMEAEAEAMKVAGVEAMKEAGVEVMKEAEAEAMMEAEAEAMKVAGVEAMKEAGVEVMKEAEAEVMKEAGVEVMKVAGVEVMKEAGVVMSKAGVVAMKAAGAVATKEAGVVVEGAMVAVEGEEWAAVGEGTEDKHKIHGLLVFLQCMLF
nr:unnamed protein product [Digitaria exilis]